MNQKKALNIVNSVPKRNTGEIGSFSANRFLSQHLKHMNEYYIAKLYAKTFY